jgi:hypothetical protein
MIHYGRFVGFAVLLGGFLISLAFPAMRESDERNGPATSGGGKLDNLKF